MGTYRANVTDRDQSVLEESAFEGGVPVFEDHQTRVVAKGAQTSLERTQNAGTHLGSNAGVVLSDSDKPCEFPSDTIGRP